MVQSMMIAASAACAADLVLIGLISMLRIHLQSAEETDSVLLGLLEMDALMLVFCLLIGIVIFAYIFFRRQERSFRNLSRISAAMQNISDGDLNTMIEIEGEDEIALMAENLNKMVDDLRTLMDRERDSERTKNELITNVAHDLRTPLTSIIGYLELLSQSGNLPEETRKRYLDIAYAKSRRLQQLIEDLFSFTKLGGGKVAMRLSRVDVVRLLNQLLEEFYPSFRAQHLTYELTSNVPARVILADANLLARLFDNLINNAIKYGADGKKVSVEVESEDEQVTVRVKNYGYVIPESELPYLFNRFYRVEQSRSSSTGGTGLGLAIVKNIVDMHGGTVRVTSDLSGTVFIVTLKNEPDQI